MENQKQNAAPQGAADGAAFNEVVKMEVLLIEARRELAEAEGIATGKLMRLTLTNDYGEQKDFVVPFRVAAYMRKVMGAPALLPSTLRAVFTSRGITVCLVPTTEGYIALTTSLIACISGEQRRLKRKMRQNKTKMKQIKAEAKKGGAAQ